jgi:hypothetical protein
MGLVAVCEDLLEEHNRVTLDSELTDSHGIPAPWIHYSLSENSARMLDFAVARGTEAMEAAGTQDAEMMTAMASSSSIAVASYAHVRAADREQSIEKVLRFIFAGFESARR